MTTKPDLSRVRIRVNVIIMHSIEGLGEVGVSYFHAQVPGIVLFFSGGGAFFGKGPFAPGI